MDKKARRHTVTDLKNDTVTLAYSPCPNDTFLFHAMVHGLVDRHGLTFDTTLNDVEALNRSAAKSRFDVSKLSAAAMLHLGGKYKMLRSGAALGRGCGPLIVAKKEAGLESLAGAKIVVPGVWTTAFLLASLYLKGDFTPVPMRFDRIMPAVQSGEYAYGVIIHEGRFTYSNYGLACLLDLGRWWEESTSLPIPLGVIGIREETPPEQCRVIEQIIRKSVVHARQNPAASQNYVRQHAQELSEDVIRQHIDLYVNDFTEHIGETGERALARLFQEAAGAGIIPATRIPLFAT